MAETFANNASGTLSAGISNVDTSLTLQTGEGAEFPATGNFRVVIGSEIVIVGARTGDTLSSLTRGAESTTAASHSSGAAVTQAVTAGALGTFAQAAAYQALSDVDMLDYTLYEGADITTTSGSFVDVDATNVKVDVVVPASGAVLLRATTRAALSHTVLGEELYFNFRDGTTNLTGTDDTVFSNFVASVPYGIRVSHAAIVTGLTPGASKTFKLGFRVSAGTGYVRPSVVLEAWKARV